MKSYSKCMKEKVHKYVIEDMNTRETILPVVTLPAATVQILNYAYALNQSPKRYIPWKP